MIHSDTFDSAELVRVELGHCDHRIFFLNSGGPAMHLTAILPNGDYQCVWDTLDGPIEHSFPPAMLTELKESR